MLPVRDWSPLVTDAELERTLDHFRNLVDGHLSKQVEIRQKLEVRVAELEERIKALERKEPARE